MIESLNIVHLIVGNGEVLILAGGKESGTVVKSIGLRVVLVGLLRLEILIQCSREQAPTTQVEETVAFHSQFYTTLPAQCLASIVLRCKATIEADVTLA